MTCVWTFFVLLPHALVAFVKMCDPLVNTSKLCFNEYNVAFQALYTVFHRVRSDLWAW